MIESIKTRNLENFRNLSSSIRWATISKILFITKATTALGVAKGVVNRAKTTFIGGSILLVGLHFAPLYWRDFCDGKLFATTYNTLFSWEERHLDLRTDLSGKRLVNQLNISPHLMGKEPLKEAKAIYLQKALAHACR